MTYVITTQKMDFASEQVSWRAEIRRDDTWIAAVAGPTEADVRAKCEAVQRIDEGGESPFQPGEFAETLGHRIQQDRRDRFIAAAITGSAGWEKRGAANAAEFAEMVAQMAVVVADAVLAEADKKGGAT